jgi:hypothetical protein
MVKSTLEQEIVEAVRQLDEEYQKQVLALARDLGQLRQKITLGEWLEQASALQEELIAQYGKDFFFNSQSILDEIREERLDDILGSNFSP